jgi:hypothetical protein
MTPMDVVEYYGSIKNAAEKLGLTVDSIYKWFDAKCVPPLRQSDIEVRTAYSLKSDFTLRRLSSPSRSESEN